MKTNDPTDSFSVNFSLSGILQLLFLLLIFLQSFMQPGLFIFGQRVLPGDLVFPVVFLLWVICLLTGKTALRFHRIYWLFLLYFLAMLISITGSPDKLRSFSKLLGEFYLIALAILTFNLVKSPSDAKRVLQIWLIGTSAAVSVALISIILFYIRPANPLLEFTLYHYGAVPVGNYPRVSSLFYSPSLFCNYLLVSLFLLYIARINGWVTNFFFQTLHGLIWLSALFTISSGLGGFALGIGVWVWLFWKNTRPVLGKSILLTGVLISVLFLLISAVALQPYESPPFIWKFPFTGQTFLPSSRVLVWMDSLQTFLQNPLFGRGIGQDACQVIFQNTDGNNSLLNEAHNIYLNVGAQTGIPGLTSILLLIFFLLREFLPFKKGSSKVSVIRNGLGIAFISAFVYQGLLGSFEETRHLWILIGLILSYGHSIRNQN